MSCPHCVAGERQFNAKVVDGDRRRYRQRGPDDPTQILLDAVRDRDLKNRTLLDVGGGIGVIGHELMADGIAVVTHVEAASAYVEAAKEEALERGHAERMHVVHGDFVEQAERVPAADLVTLDRVVCCYPDWRGLLEASAERAREVLALSYPRDRWYVKLLVGLQNLVRRLTGNAFRTFVHPERAMDATIRDAGFGPAFDGGTVVWRVVVYERPPR